MICQQQKQRQELACRQVQIREGMFPEENLECSYLEAHTWALVKMLYVRKDMKGTEGKTQFSQLSIFIQLC